MQDMCSRSKITKALLKIHKKNLACVWVDGYMEVKFAFRDCLAQSNQKILQNSAVMSVNQNFVCCCCCIPDQRLCVALIIIKLQRNKKYKILS